MQSPEGYMEMSEDMKKLLGISQKLEQETGKPHPVFVKGEVVKIKGGYWMVHKLLKDRMILKPTKY